MVGLLLIPAMMHLVLLSVPTVRLWLKVASRHVTRSLGLLGPCYWQVHLLGGRPVVRRSALVVWVARRLFVCL